MSKENNLKEFLTSIANIIREKKGTTERINPQNFYTEINDIEADDGKLQQVVDKTVTEISKKRFGWCYKYWCLCVPKLQ